MDHDLRVSLDKLERIVRTTHANYHSALTTNVRMWPQLPIAA